MKKRETFNFVESLTRFHSLEILPSFLPSRFSFSPKEERSSFSRVAGQLEALTHTAVTWLDLRACERIHATRKRR